MGTLDRINRLERQLKALAAAWLLTIIAVGLVGWKGRPGQPETLRVRQVTIIDDKGTERVWIGAPVPNPIVQGQRVERAGAVSGIILLDAHGNERSGYVTSDLSGEVFLSLDSEKAQEAMFLVNPGGGGHLSIYDGDRNLAQIGVLGKGPTLALRQKGEIVFQQPKTKE